MRQKNRRSLKLQYGGIRMEKNKVIDGKSIQEWKKSSELNSELGGHLLRLRKEKGMSLEEVSVITGVSASYLYRIEIGNKIPSEPVLLKLEKAYDVVSGIFLDNATNDGRTADVENLSHPSGNLNIHIPGLLELERTMGTD
jgi:transcriptional regulator with XRE-family HTH domain